MKKTFLYLECNSGISGDMTVAALLDLGADRHVLTKVLDSLPLLGYSIEIKDVYKSGIRACDFHVILDNEHENHDHDMEYLYGGKEPDHDHHEHHHGHEARNLQEIVEIIRKGEMTKGASDLAVRIFEILAKAEASAHGKSIDEVHFHEVGAVDSIVDIVAAAVCLDNLHPDQVVISPLTEGCGQIRCQHGLMPVPVPAVTAIAANEGLTLKLTDIQGELVTPTGAAIAAAFRTDEKLPENIHILKTGLGAGKREYRASGILRAMLIEDEGSNESLQDTVTVLETNIDDCTGEALSYTMQQLMSAGALDVFYIPVYMKKNRPAYLLQVICEQKDRTAMETIIFQNTTTIGIRRQNMQRTKLSRQVITMQTPWGNADIKCCEYNGCKMYYPENDSVSRLAADNETGFSKMYGLLQSYADSHFDSER